MAESSQAINEYKFSIVIPVLNEATRINSTIGQILSLKDIDSAEIIVVDADPNGGTINKITNENVVTSISEKTRAKQMNAGADLARGEKLIFLHADTQLPPDALKKIDLTLENPKYVAGAFDLDIDSDNLLIKAIAARTRLRCRLTRVPYGDQAIFIRRKYFDEIGGFKDIPIMEDIELMQRIKKRGDRICILHDRVKTSARRWETEGIFYTTLRNMVLVSLYRFGVSPHKLARFYKSHKE